MYGNLVLRFFSFKCYLVAKTKQLLFTRFSNMLLTEKKLPLEKHSLCSKICDYLKNIATNITLVHTKKTQLKGVLDMTL